MTLSATGKTLARLAYGDAPSQLIYVIGAPGSGKSTLMRSLTSGFDLLIQESGAVPHVGLIDRATGVIVGAEIGRRRENFGGTDALASSIIEKAVPWVETTPYPLLLAEGARLANRRFLLAALEHYRLTLILLDHPDADLWRHRRAEELGREQSPSWVRGRTTASLNLARQFAEMAAPGASPFSGKITVLRGHPDEIPPLELLTGR